MNNSTLNDSLCPVTWASRPGSFVGLMTLYESNYIRLRQLLGDVDNLPERQVSTPPGDCALHLRVDERSRYTVTFTLTYRFVDSGAEIADPDLQVRIYRDARVAEALHCGRWQQHPLLRMAHWQAARATHLRNDQRWQRNMLLNKWLDYCSDRGHCFTAAPVR